MVVCPITSAKKGYPWEVELRETVHVTGVVLSDQVKSLDWKERNAEFICAADRVLLAEVTEKAIALLDPEEED